MNLILPLLCSVMLIDGPAAAPLPTAADTKVSDTRVIVVVGAEGTAEYGRQFQEWAGRWEAAAKLGTAAFTAIGLEPLSAVTDYDLLKQKISQLAGPSQGATWLILIGHGTFDGKVARFNLRGPDVKLSELAEWLAPVEYPLAVVNCASSSGPILNELSGPNRVIIAATKSGHEYNFSRFGDYLSAAIADPQADLDKDEQTSLLEAFLLASSRVREFYAADGRLMTEHALLDDNGDRLGTPADFFQGVRATKSARNGAAVDGQRASQWNLVRSRQEADMPANVRARRDQLEQDLATARQQKSQLSEDEYLKLVEPLLIELAELYESAGMPAKP